LTKLTESSTVKQYNFQLYFYLDFCLEGRGMRETTANRFRQRLKPEVDRCIADHEALRVTRRNGENFIVLGEEDWYAMAETVYLNQVPGLAESIQDAAREPLEDGTSLEDLEW
jgi:antitoxin YefM